MSFVLLHGWAVVDGYEPDGDTVRFIPDDMRAFFDLERAHLATPGANTSVCVRLEGIDAPELHYAGAAQPEGKPALELLLRAIHWPPSAEEAASAPAGAPRGVRVVVMTRGCDSHGRIIGYLFPSEIARVDTTTVERLSTMSALSGCVNARIVASGAAYPLAYRSQPVAHRALFRSLGAAARARSAGVWARDRSQTGFVLRSAASLGPYGELVFPKLFRRSVTFFREAPTWMSFHSWLRDRSGVDDEVRAGEGRWTRLSAMLREEGRRLWLEADPVALIFAQT